MKNKEAKLTKEGFIASLELCERMLNNNLTVDQVSEDEQALLYMFDFVMHRMFNKLIPKRTRQP